MNEYQYPLPLATRTHRIEMVLKAWKKYMGERALPYKGEPEEDWTVEYAIHEVVGERWRVGYSIYDEGYTTIFHAQFSSLDRDDKLDALCFIGDDMDNFEVVPLD